MKKLITCSGLLLLLVSVNIGIKKLEKIELNKKSTIKVATAPKKDNSFDLEELMNNPEVVKVASDTSVKDELQMRIDALNGALEGERFIQTMRHTKGGIIVGYNYNISKLGIEEEVASVIVEKVIEKDKKKLEKYDWFNDLDPVRKEAVQNLAYNLGVGGLLKFDYFITHLKNENYDAAGKSLLYTDRGTKSRYYRQVKGRAKNIADQVSSGVAKESFLDTIKRHEGFRKYPYQDTRGFWTVGYGINLEGRGFKQDEAVMLLATASLNNESLIAKYNI